MFRCVSSILVVLFGIAGLQVVRTEDQDVFDLVDDIAGMPFFVPGIGPILRTSIKILAHIGSEYTDIDMSENEEEESSSLDRIDKGLDEVINSINEMKNQIPNEIQIGDDLKELYGKIDEVRNFFEDYVSKYRSGRVSYKSKDAREFVEMLDSSDGGLKYDMNRISQILHGDRQSQNLLQALQETGNFEVLMCREVNSYQIRIVQIDHDVTKTECKALQLAYFRFNVTIHLAQGSEEFDHAYIELHSYVESFKKRMTELRTTFKEAMKNVPRDFWKCDPMDSIEGGSFVKLDPIFHTVMVEEIHLRQYNRADEDPILAIRSSRKLGDCDRFKKARDSRETDGDPNRCRGFIRDCYDSENDASVCMRRVGERYKYEQISFENGDIWGEQQASCEKRINFESISNLDGREDICLCTCDAEHMYPAVRWFSTLECSSDYPKNKVITGVKLSKSGSYIHFDIQQASLRGKGGVDKPEWKPACTEASVESSGKTGNAYRVTWDSNAINLDDLSCPTGRIVTGVRFNVDQSALGLKLRCTSFNFSSGQLHRDNHTFAFVPGRRPGKFIDNHLPTDTGNTVVLSGVGSSIHFMKSNDQQDVGSTLVPWIDIQKVSVKNPTPLAGISLIHRSNAQSSGYLALKIKSLDFSHYSEPGSQEKVWMFANNTLMIAKRATDIVRRTLSKRKTNMTREGKE